MGVGHDHTHDEAAPPKRRPKSPFPVTDIW